MQFTSSNGINMITGSSRRNKLNSEDYETNATFNNGIRSFITTTAGYDVCQNVYLYIDRINDEEIKAFLWQFTWQLQQSLIKQELAYSSGLCNYLPPLLINELEDGSVLLEWIFNKFRVLFSFEKNISESFVLLTTSKGFDLCSNPIPLNKEKLGPTLDRVLSYVLRYS